MNIVKEAYIPENCTVKFLPLTEHLQKSTAHPLDGLKAFWVWERKLNTID
jgi:hypothetical protein